MRRVILGVILVGILWWPSIVVGQADDKGVTIHVVQRGDTLFRIATRYNVTIDDLVRLNGITDPSNIQVGQRLLVPVRSGPNKPVEQPKTHVVKRGETLQTIAQAYGLNIQDLVKQNNIVNPNAIFAGQVLNIRPIAAAPTALPALLPPASSPSLESTQLIHVVQPGETLFRIATRYHLTVNELARANTIDDPTLIYAGQQILIPSRQESQASLDLPSPVSSVDGTAAPFIEGKTGRIRLVTTVPVNMSVSFFGKPVGSVAEENNTRHTILVGIPIFTEPGLYPLAFTMTDATGQQTNFSVNVQIASGNYGREFITLKSDRAELLDPNLETSEQTLLQGIMGAFTPQRYFEGPMSLPAAANMTSPFGRKRSYNGGPFDHFHSGTDFAGASGTPVLAAASGVVAFAGALNVRGNATIIDHGWGVFTGYWHQTDQYVKVGDSVTTGQVIGTIGSSGRVTGPHLHWELWVNGVPVDPMQWVRQSFS